MLLNIFITNYIESLKHHSIGLDFVKLEGIYTEY